MTWTLQRYDEHRQVPWRNGAGGTAEIVSVPHGADEFDWRVSIADVVDDGAFSVFEGIDRTIVNLTDVRMRLVVDGAEHDLQPFEPFAFDGGATTTCTVSGPTRDFNAMARRGRADATVRVHRVTVAHTVSGVNTWVVVLGGEVTLDAQRLHTGDAVHLTGGSLTLGGDGHVAVVSATVH